MSDLAKFLVGAAGLVTAICVLGGAFLWLVKPRIAQWMLDVLGPMQAKVTETHHQVTKNSHASATPTILDLIADVKDEIGDLGGKFATHVLTEADARAALERRLSARIDSGR
jgi:hypothetical protein